MIKRINLPLILILIGSGHSYKVIACSDLFRGITGEEISSPAEMHLDAMAFAFSRIGLDTKDLTAQALIFEAGLIISDGRLSTLISGVREVEERQTLSAFRSDLQSTGLPWKKVTSQGEEISNLTERVVTGIYRLGSPGSYLYYRFFGRVAAAYMWAADTRTAKVVVEYFGFPEGKHDEVLELSLPGSRPLPEIVSMFHLPVPARLFQLEKGPVAGFTAETRYPLYRTGAESFFRESGSKLRLWTESQDQNGFWKKVDIRRTGWAEEVHGKWVVGSGSVIDHVGREKFVRFGSKARKMPGELFETIGIVMPENEGIKLGIKELREVYVFVPKKGRIRRFIGGALRGIGNMVDEIVE